MVNLINLPSPHPLLPSLLEAGYNHETAAAASKAYQQRAEEFKRRTETMLVAALQKMAALPGGSASSDSLTRKDVSSFTEFYLRCLEEWKEEMLQLLKQASKVPPKSTPPKYSRPFNHEYLPLLEHFFDENPFPTHADKVFLAEKSNMHYRQIHVWFQNRRSRTKKEGKLLRKKPIPEGAAKPLDRLRERMKGHVVKPVPEIPEASVLKVNNRMRITQTDATKCLFVSSPPPHAFPTSYPPACAYDPFPCKRGSICFGKPEWKRLPCLRPAAAISVSIDDLVEKFSQLNVRCNGRVKGFSGLRSHAATTAITVVPSRAPHPSLIAHKQPSFARVIVRQPLVRAASSRLHAFRSPSPTSQPITLVPLSVPSHRTEPPTKQSTAPLQPRFPSRMQDAERDTTHSEYSPTSSSPDVHSGRSDGCSCSCSSASSLSSPANTAS